MPINTEKVYSETLDVNIEDISTLPPMLNRLEWITFNLFDFFNRINEIWSIFSVHCECTSDCGRYTWKGESLSPSDYINRTLSVSSYLINEFPVDSTQKYRPSIAQDITFILTTLEATLEHISSSHRKSVNKLIINVHIDTITQHFQTFCRLNNLRRGHIQNSDLFQDQNPGL